MSHPPLLRVPTWIAGFRVPCVTYLGVEYGMVRPEVRLWRASAQEWIYEILETQSSVFVRQLRRGAALVTAVMVPFPESERRSARVGGVH